MNEALQRVLAACAPPVRRTGELDCLGVMATADEWQSVRAVAMEVAERAAFEGYASDRFGSWEVCAQRHEIGAWPPGVASLRLSLLQGQRVLGQWLADLPMTGELS
jgi:hypothetical protein